MLNSRIKESEVFIQELCFGVMRWYTRLDFIVDSLTDKPLKKKDLDLKHLLFIGIYQLEYLRTPEHAAISATVDGCKILKKVWAKNMVNAVLRPLPKGKC